MKSVFHVVFVVLLIVAAYFVFLPQAPFPSTNTSFITAELLQFLR